jgi:hypothetical protein
MTRTGNAARDWALSQDTWHTGYCLVFTRSCFDVAARYGTARLAWDNAQKRHQETDPSRIPANVPVWWTGGSRGYGHVAFSLGGGLCRSTDWPSAGQVSTTHISNIHTSWGHTLVGWTEDINGVTVASADNFNTVTVLDASNVAAAAKASRSVEGGKLLKKAVATEVGAGKMDLTSSALGAAFRVQYRLVQTRYLHAAGLPVNQQSADGIPGLGSLTWLGKRQGFSVKP